jgi:hypothetical protein
MRPARRLPAIMSLLLGALASSGFATPANVLREIRLFDLTTAHAIVGNRPFQPTQVFAPEDSPIYVWYRAEGCTTGTTIRSIWYYLETEAPLRFSEGTVTVEHLDDWGQFNFELAPGKRWPIGRYRVELRIEDELMAEIGFRIASSVESTSHLR